MSSRRFLCEPGSALAARQFAREALGDLPDEIVGAVELMVSELATNSVKHAQTDFEIAIDAKDPIRVEVRDKGQGQPAVRSPTPEEPSGRGLRIVEAMSDAWGVEPSSYGKTVWFELKLVASGSSQSAVSRKRQVEEPARTGPRREGDVRHASRSAHRTQNASRRLRPRFRVHTHPLPRRPSLL
jgi:anti-sigma regulatory factor (Ser/Thr protein kinase)